MSNIVSLNQQRLVRKLGEFSPNLVYSIAPKRYVLRGFDYYRKGFLLEFKWSRDFSELQAIVSGNRHYSVKFSLNGHGLDYSCDCPAWNPSTNCKHTVCTLITIKNLFDPSSYRIPTRDEEHREYLSECLFSMNGAKIKKVEDRKYSVVFQINDHNPDIYVLRNGKRLAVPSYSEPEELGPLIFPLHYRYPRKQSLAKRYLEEHGNKYPLVLKSDGGETSVEFDDSLDYSCMTEFDARSRHVKVSRVLKKMTATNRYFLASSAARIKYHFVINPALGGMPIMARAANIRAKQV